jgi:hypothetical protein
MQRHKASSSFSSAVSPMIPCRCAAKKISFYPQRRYRGRVKARMVLCMALNFPNPSRSFEIRRNAVHFWGYDQSMETSFYISADALQQLTPGAGRDEAALLASFDRHAPAIRQAAIRLYGSGKKGGSYDLHPSHF